MEYTREYILALALSKSNPINFLGAGPAHDKCIHCKKIQGYTNNKHSVHEKDCPYLLALTIIKS